MSAKEFFITEMEWWDRIAMAVDLLLKKPGVQKKKLLAGSRVVEWTGNAAPAEAFPAADPGRPAEVTAYVFTGVQDSEILRRLSQMPDETPLDLLTSPFSIYCTENNSFVSINRQDLSLQDHLKKVMGHE